MLAEGYTPVGTTSGLIDNNMAEGFTVIDEKDESRIISETTEPKQPSCEKGTEMHGAASPTMTKTPGYCIPETPVVDPSPMSVKSENS